MSLFTKKSIAAPKRVCLCLKEARDRKNTTLEEMGKRLRIDTKYIEALETCRFSELPFSPMYQKHLIRAYMAVLGIDASSMVEQFSREELSSHSHGTVLLPNSMPRTHNLPMMLRFGAIAFVVLACFSYLGLQVHRILEPPTLLVFSPEQGHITDQSVLSVTGQTDPEVQVSINGTNVLQNEQGKFSATLDLPTGVNTLMISARKKHGKTTTETRHIIVRQGNNQFSRTDTISPLADRL